MMKALKSFNSILFRAFSASSVKMKKAVDVLISKENDIYFNLAMENYLLSSYGAKTSKGVESNSPLLFLWRNTPCVIVGRNQNVWSECNLGAVEEDNVKIVRRFTGGGAVYQDLGNTCFTLISPSDEYSFEQNSKLICSAIGKLISRKCEPTGRNDLCVEGLKFSGMAFKVLPNAALQHGTLLININEGSLDKYLTPERSKLERHNVQSVKSRVTNLAHFSPDISHSKVCDAVIKEFVEYYGEKPKEIVYLGLDSEYCKDEDFKTCYDKLTDEKWIYGDRVMQTGSFKRRFDFGSVQFCFNINDGIVEQVWIFSDCLNADFIEHMIKKFNEKPFKYVSDNFDEILKTCDFPGCAQMLAEIRGWMSEVLPE